MFRSIVAFCALLAFALESSDERQGAYGFYLGTGGADAQRFSTNLFGSANTNAASSSSSSGNGFGFSIPGFGGSSFSLKSTEPSQSVGGAVEFKENGVNFPIQLGPAGGVQAEVVLPVLPSLSNIMKMVQQNFGMFGGFMSTMFNQATNFMGMIGDNVQKFLSAAGVQMTQLVGQAGSLLNQAIKSGLLTAQKGSEVVSSIIKSALSNQVNFIAKFIDFLQSAIKQKIILEEQAIKLLVKAVKDGVHKIDGAADWSLNTFLDNATKAKTITEDVAKNLKSFVNNSASNFGISTESKTSESADSTTSDSANEVEDNTASATEVEVSAAATTEAADNTASTDDAADVNVTVDVNVDTAAEE